MFVHQGFDFGGPDFEAAGIDHPLHAVDHEEIAVFVVITQIAGAQEGLAVMLNQRLLRGLFVVPVAFEHLRPGHQDFAGFVGAKFAVICRVHHAAIHVKHRNAQTLTFRRIGRVDMGGGHRFGHAVAFDIIQSGHVF